MERPEGREGPGGDSIGSPCLGRMTIAAGEKDGSMADGAAVNGKWDRTG